MFQSPEKMVQKINQNIDANDWIRSSWCISTDYRDLRRIRGYVCPLLILRKISPQTRLDLSMNIYIDTHLLRNVLSNYWCGMHQTCKDNSVKPNRRNENIYHLYKSLWLYESPHFWAAWKRSRKSKCVESDHLKGRCLVTRYARPTNPAANRIWRPMSRQAVEDTMTTLFKK